MLGIELELELVVELELEGPGWSGWMSPGEICWVRLRAPVGETEIDCRRPAVVLQNPAESALLPTVLVVPLTLEFEALRLPGTVAVEPDGENGLGRSLVALVFQLTAVDASLLEPTTGRVSGATLGRIRQELARLTGEVSEWLDAKARKDESAKGAGTG